MKKQAKSLVTVTSYFSASYLNKLSIMNISAHTFVLLVIVNIVTYSFELSFSSSLFFSTEGHSGSHL